MAGRPTAFKKEYIKQVEKLCKLGLTDVELAEFFEVTEKTLNNWKQSHPEFFQSLKKGKIVADAEVANKLFQRAMGFDYTEVTREADEVGQMKITKKVKKHVAPDTGAQCFWLKNRQPKNWRDKNQTEIIKGEDVEVTLNID